jgi:urease gamma subunit
MLTSWSKVQNGGSFSLFRTCFGSATDLLSTIAPNLRGGRHAVHAWSYRRDQAGGGGEALWDKGTLKLDQIREVVDPAWELMKLLLVQAAASGLGRADVRAHLAKVEGVPAAVSANAGVRRGRAVARLMSGSSTVVTVTRVSRLLLAHFLSTLLPLCLMLLLSLRPVPLSTQLERRLFLLLVLGGLLTRLLCLLPLLVDEVLVCLTTSGLLLLLAVGNLLPMPTELRVAAPAASVSWPFLIRMPAATSKTTVMMPRRS